MNKEELMTAIVRSFFIIVAGTVASIGIFCAVFYPEAMFGIDIFPKILLTALASDALFIIFYSNKDISKKQMFVRQVIHAVLLLAVLLFFSYIWDWIDFGNAKEVAAFISLVLGVYAVVYAFVVYQDKKLADKLNSGLQERYGKQNGESNET